MRTGFVAVVWSGMILVSVSGAWAQRQMEFLDRGMVALNTGSGVWVSWRMLGTDPGNIAFNLYRRAAGGSSVLLTPTPISGGTWFVDTTANLGVTNEYFVRPVINGVEYLSPGSYTLAANAPVRQYISVPLMRPSGGRTPDGVTYTYDANDMTVGDLDGDGQYELILKWEPTNAKDPSQDGYTGPVYVDAYKLNGTRLWRINLGRNIRAGAHYTQVMAYDFDGDGRAEVIMKTADATVDGTGQVIGNPSADYRNSSGRILSGPEYLTVFDGLTGAAKATIAFEPVRGSVSSWGDNYGNRVDRFLATPAYLDGQRPSLIFARGYYGPQSGYTARNEIAAYDYRNGQLTLRWIFKANSAGPNEDYIGQGAHSIAVGDVDGDGYDEVIYGAAAIDHNGLPLYSTGLGHGDALHVSDMVPSRPGLEVWMVHEAPGYNGGVGAALRDTRTGEVIFSVPASSDVGRGVAADIDPNHPGYEMWSTADGWIYSASGQALYSKGNISHNFLVWWDGDLLRELEDGTKITKWNWETQTAETLLSPSGIASNNGTKATPCLVADILGDWREEVIWRSSDNTEVRIYISTIPTEYRFYTLMHDPVYRMAIAWQNVAYNQPPHPGFFLGAGMGEAPVPEIYLAGGKVPLVVLGDTNLDGVVDLADYNNVVNNLGATGAGVLGDTNWDGIVDLADYNNVVNNLGAVGWWQSAPEPGAWVMMMVGMGWLVRRGRDRR